MKTSELLKLFKKHGIRLQSHGGNHDLYYSPLTNATFPVPRHKAEIKTGTLNKILRDAGLK